jgi:hypothetical protein
VRRRSIEATSAPSAAIGVAKIRTPTSVSMSASFALYDTAEALA